jgi:hypothetical protein
MSKYVIMNQIKEGSGGDYNEETGLYESNVQYIPTAINLDAVRNFFPRHEGKPGTRLTFTDGGGFPVREAFDQVLTVVAKHQGSPVAPVEANAAPQLASSAH